MSSSHSPYVFDVPSDGTDPVDETPTEEQEVVIVDGRAMSYRWYRRRSHERVPRPNGPSRTSEAGSRRTSQKASP